MKYRGHRARLREKENLFRYRAYFEGNLLRFVRASAHVRANDPKILRSGDAHCNTEELVNHKTRSIVLEFN